MIGQELRSLMPCGVATKSTPAKKTIPKTDQVKQVKMMARVQVEARRLNKKVQRDNTEV